MRADILDDLADAIALRVEKRIKESFGEEKQAFLNSYLTVEGVCDKLHISKSKFYRHQKLGYVKPTKYVGRTPLFDENTIQEYLNVFVS